MKDILGFIVNAILLVLFLAGSLGFTASKHICSSSHKVSISLSPVRGISEKGCCEPASEENGSLPLSSGDESLDSTGCCKTFRLYFHASFLTTAPVRHLISFCQFESLVTGNLQPVASIQDHDGVHLAPEFNDTGPPLSGRDRILIFNQIRIPFPPDFCC